jgi:hypothetical protein
VVDETELRRWLEQCDRNLATLTGRVCDIERRHIGEDARDDERERHEEWSQRKVLAYLGLGVACTAVLVNILDSITGYLF